MSSTTADIFRAVITGWIGKHRFPRPKGQDLVTFVAGKVVFLALAFGIPLLFHDRSVVLVYYGVGALRLGLVLSVVFQLAHCVEQAEFPLPRNDTGCIDNAWAIHPVETSVDFARHSRSSAPQTSLRRSSSMKARSSSMSQTGAVASLPAPSQTA